MLLRPRHWFVSHPRNGHRPHLLRVEGWLTSLVFFLGFGWIVIASFPWLPAVMGSSTDITADQLLVLINAERAKADLAPLESNAALSAAAAAKAEHMMAHDYWSHNAPDGTTPWSFIRAAGYTYASAGENLARNFTSAQSMVGAWMASPSHRRNILQGEYQETGIAVREGRMNGHDTILVVEMFGRPKTAPAGQAQRPSTPGGPDPGQALQATGGRRPGPQEVGGVNVLAAESHFTVSQFRLLQLGTMALLTFLIIILVADMVITDQKHRERFGKNLAHAIALAVVMVAALLARTGRLGGGI